jgi:hypothetical protein
MYAGNDNDFSEPRNGYGGALQYRSSVNGMVEGVLGKYQKGGKASFDPYAVDEGTEMAEPKNGRFYTEEEMESMSKDQLRIAKTLNDQKASANKESTKRYFQDNILPFIPGMDDGQGRRDARHERKALAQRKKFEDEATTESLVDEEIPAESQVLQGTEGDPYEYLHDGKGNYFARKKGDTAWARQRRASKAHSAIEKQFNDRPNEVAIGDPLTQDEISTTPLSGNSKNRDKRPRSLDQMNALKFDPITSELPSELAQVDAPDSIGIPQAKQDSKRNRGPADYNGIAGTLSDVATGALNVAPHLQNIKDYENLPGIVSPRLQKAVYTNAPSLEADRQAIKAQGRSMQNAANQGSPNIAANTRALSATQQSLSRLAGQESMIEAQNDARNAQASSQVQRSNIANLNQYDKDKMERELYQQKGIAGERNAIYSGVLGTIGQANQRKLDKERMKLLGKAYNRYGQLGRTLGPNGEVKYGV